MSMQHPSENFSARRSLHMASGDSAAKVAQPSSAATALVVEPSLDEAARLVTTLTSCGFDVTVADSFIKAKAHLGARAPTVLVTELRLADYNGLHLVLRGTSMRPDMAAIVLSSANDPGLQPDAEALGATFMLKPVDQKELVAATLRTVASLRSAGRVTSPIRPPFERRLGERRMPQEMPTPAEGTLERRRGERRSNPQRF